MDDPKFWPILEAAEALNRPIYLHPRSPSELISKPYADYGMAHALWGFQAEAGLHAMRLMMSGVFDRFPKLKIILGHMGESIPYNLWRCDYMYENRKSAYNMPTKIQRNLSGTIDKLNRLYGNSPLIDAQVGPDSYITLEGNLLGGEPEGGIYFTKKF